MVDFCVLVVRLNLNLRGAWRPSTRIWHVALAHRASGTSNHRNLHHLHPLSSFPPFLRPHPPPYRDPFPFRLRVSHYRSSRRRYHRNHRRSPASRRREKNIESHVLAPSADTTLYYSVTVSSTWVYSFHCQAFLFLLFHCVYFVFWNSREFFFGEGREKNGSCWLFYYRVM